jgi:hypothetical protein
VAIDLGDLYRCNYTNLTPAGGPATAGTMTLTITLPDGTAATPVVVTATGAGVYTYDYPTVQAGRHSARWLGTGANPGAHVEVFDVRPADVPYIVSLADAKAQLNMTATAQDEELRSYLEATTGVVERHLGQAVVRRTFTEEHSSAGSVVLDWPPVVSLTSMALVDGTYTWDVATLHVSPWGVVTSPRGVAPYGRVTVAYTAGMAIVPQHYALAARIILQHLWETQRGSSGGARPGGLGDTFALKTNSSGMGYAIPNRAVELLGAGLPGLA